MKGSGVGFLCPYPRKYIPLFQNSPPFDVAIVNVGFPCVSVALSSRFHCVFLSRTSAMLPHCCNGGGHGVWLEHGGVGTCTDRETYLNCLMKYSFSCICVKRTLRNREEAGKLKSGVTNKGVCLSRKALRCVRSSRL